MSNILKITVKNMEALPEPLREFATQEDDVVTVSLSDETGPFILKSLDEEQAHHKRYEDSEEKSRALSEKVKALNEGLEAYKGVAPGDVFKWKDQIENMDDFKDLEKKASELASDQIKQARQDFESQLSSVSTQLELANKRIADQDSRFEQDQIDRVAVSALTKKGNEQVDLELSADWLKKRLSLAKDAEGQYRRGIDGNIEVEVREPNGAISLSSVTGKPITVEEYVAQKMKRDKPHLFMANVPAGGGAHGGRTSSAPSKNVFKEGTTQEQFALINSDPDTARQQAREAGKPESFIAKIK